MDGWKADMRYALASLFVQKKITAEVRPQGTLKLLFKKVSDDVEYSKKRVSIHRLWKSAV
jgi:hypothetical protein